MKTESIEDLAELLEVADAAVAAVLEDRQNAPAEGRDPLTIWDLFGQSPPALALAERRLELATRRVGTRGDA